MKVTVTFNTVKIVVPCGDGEITVRELTQLATTRYKKATGKPRLSWVSVHSLKAKEGGILDPDDRLVDVCDDREQLIAFYDEEGIPQGGDGMSASSDESETTGGSSGYNRNTDIEVSGEFGVCALQVRRGSEPALNKLESGVQGGQSGGGHGQHYHGGEENKRWSAAVMNRDIRSSKNDLSVIDEASFYGDANFDPGGGRYSPLPPPFERGQGSGAARDSDRPTPFSRDSNRLSMQIGHEDGRWLEAAEKASSDQNQGFQPPPPSSTAIEADFGAGRLGSGRTCHPVRREPLGGSSPPQHSLDRDSFTRFVIHNEIGPLGIHVVPSGDPEAAGLLIQGIEPGGRIDRDGRLAVNDRIVEINGYPLTEIPFHKAQEIFKEALFAKELLLVVDKSEESARQELMEDNMKI
jgi:partitioning defective protein 3